MHAGMQSGSVRKMMRSGIDGSREWQSDSCTKSKISTRATHRSRETIAIKSVISITIWFITRHDRMRLQGDTHRYKSGRLSILRRVYEIYTAVCR